MRATRKDPPEKILADLAKKYPQLLNLTAPQRDDRLQQDDRSYTDMGVDVLRALSQPLNYMREIGQGNYVPTQAELEGSGVSAMEGVAALANPFDHVYATLAMAGVIDDPNYDNEYSSAALLGLVTGSAGEKVPKALEKTVKLLREEGVKSYGDILPALRKNKDSEAIKELSDLKDKAIDFSKHIQKFGHDAYSQAKSSAPQGLSTWGTGGSAVNAALNFMIESEPDALMKFTPEKFDAGAFDASMQKFADQYLTGFRSVKAKDEANAIKYITNPIGTGHGGMNLGPGLYHGTRSSQISGTDGTARPDYGPHLGVIRIAPEIGTPGSSASQIIKALQKYEFLGDTQGAYDLRHGLHKKGVYPGFKTSQEIRVSRSGTPVNLLDYANTPEGRANLFNTYNPDYYGAEYNPNKPRGFDLLPPDYSEGGVMGMRPIRKKNRLMEMLDARKARRAKGGDQVINTSNTFTTDLEPDDPLFQEIRKAQGPYPIGAAEVVGTPTQYEEADLAKAGLLALREAGGVVPGLDYALDAAELENISRTGKDFYGDETTPESYAAMVGAGLLLPGIVRRPARALGKAFGKVGKRFANMGGSKIDWGAWNPEIPQNKDLLKEYNEIEKRTKRDGTWMKNADGTDFDGPPELFIQTQSKAFKEAFPEGYDKLYRGVRPGRLNRAYPEPRAGSPVTFYSEDIPQASQYTGAEVGGPEGYQRKRLFEDTRRYTPTNMEDLEGGLFELAYPSEKNRTAINVAGSHWQRIEKFSPKAIEPQKEYIKQLRQELSDPTKNKSVTEGRLDRAEAELRFMESPRSVSSDKKIQDFYDRYYEWANKRGVMNADYPSTDLIANFLQDNPDLNRIIFRGLDDEYVGDVNILSNKSGVFPKSLIGNRGTFDLSDPNVFKALLPIVGGTAAVRASRRQGEDNSMAAGGVITMRKKRNGMSTIRK